MLTVIRRAGEEVQRMLGEGVTDPLALWETALEQARVALSLTPTQLPALQEAGVVDSGGLGIVAILAGALDFLKTGNTGPVELELGEISGIEVALTGVETSISGDFLHSSEEAEWGYCTQFLLEGEGLSLEQVREDINGLADSVVVIGDDEMIRVHAHLMDPGAALTYGVGMGQLSQISIENMSIQNRGLGSRASGPASGGARDGGGGGSFGRRFRGAVSRRGLRRTGQGRADHESQHPAVDGSGGGRRIERHHRPAQ